MRRLRWRRRDEGSAMILVLGAMSVLLMVATTSLNYSVDTVKAAGHSADWNRAFAAAQAGIDDYLARLNRNDNYWFTTDCANKAMKKPWTTAGAPCGYGSTTPVGWLPVPQGGGAEFHYDVSTTDTPIDGTIDVVATGRSNKVTRSIQATLRRGGFGEFLYYTVYETIDPSDERVYGANNSTAQDKCAHYFWEPYVAGVSKPRDTSYCADISFVTGDKITGPIHTNDAILVNGSPRFAGTVTTSWPKCYTSDGSTPNPTDCYRKLTSSSAPQLDRGIGYRAEIELPTSIGDLRQYVTAGQTTNLGCLYTGPTRIKFLGSSGQMRVWSPYSFSSNPGCGTAGTASGQLRNSGGALVNVPNNKLIMVQNVPASQSQPNFTTKCPDGGIGDGYPQAGDANQTLQEANCRFGTVYLQGSLKGRTTIAADNNILITDDLVYSGGITGADALGLIANNSVKIYHPIGRVCTYTYTYRGGTYCYSYDNEANLPIPGGGYNDNVTVNAAILTLQHSFTVQAYQYGNSLGTIHLFGTIAQRYRGPVGTTGSGGTGYLKDYVYDTRMRYAPPPYFLDPVRAGWGQKTFGEVKPRYGG